MKELIKKELKTTEYRIVGIKDYRWLLEEDTENNILFLYIEKEGLDNRIFIEELPKNNENIILMKSIILDNYMEHIDLVEEMIVIKENFWSTYYNIKRIRGRR